MSHIPQRSCIVCRQMKPKETLVSVTRLSTKEIVVGDKKAGRSVYICSSVCLEKLKKDKRDLLSMLLKMKVTKEEVFEKLDPYFEKPVESRTV